MLRKMSKFFIFLLLFQTITSSLVPPSQIKAEEASNKLFAEIEENIISNVTLYQIMEGDERIELEPGEEIIVEDPYDEFQVLLNYQFELPNDHSYGDGSTFTITIPDMFTIQPNPEPTPLLAPDGTEYGSFIVTADGEVVITFNENIESNSNVSGYLELWSAFDSHFAGPAEGETITFPISDGETIEFPVTFKPNTESIDKKGVPNKAYNTESIEWTVDFNKDLESIENATLEDITEGAHEFIEDSIKVYKLHMNADGTINEEATEQLADDLFGTEFPLNLGDIDSAYRIVYETTITDEEGVLYSNKAILDGDNIDPVEAEASVDVKRGQPLEKRASDYDPITQTVTWEVKFNYDEKVIPQERAILTDVFGENQELIEGSFIVTEFDIDPDTGEEIGEGTVVDNYNITETDSGFILQFDDEIDKAYKIIYQTKAINRVDDGFTVENNISDDYGNDRDGSRWVEQQILHKSNNSNDTDYDEKSTSWTVRMNTDEYTMEDVSFVDTLPNGFTPRDIVITHDSVQWEEGTHYSWNFNEENNQLSIDFNQDITKEVYITYTTDIDFNEIDHGVESFENHVVVEWTPEGESESVEKEASATFNPDDYTKANGFKNASYNPVTKVIDWEIGVNYNRVSLENVTVDDYILGNQNFDISSVQVYHLELLGSRNGVEKGDELDPDEYEVEEITNDDGEKGFRVILGDIDSPYLITYQTDLNDQLVAETYDNTATVNSDNREAFDLIASVSPNYGGEYTNKSAEQNDENPRIVNWSVNINYAQSTVSNVSISDTPSVNQMLLRDTIMLYATVVNEDGSITKGELLEENTDYTLEFTENEDDTETFIITFTAEQIDRAYVLEYDTRIMFEDDGYISNDVKFEGDETVDIDTDDSINQRIDLTGIGGGIDGEVGSLEVLKVDAETDEPLEGATFELYDENGHLVLSQTTDEDGKATFTKLLYRDYTLKETDAPEGYVVGIEDEQTVTVDSEMTTLTVENKRIIRDVELTKLDADTKEALENVQFRLLDENEEVIPRYENLTTNEDGIIYISELEPGTYYFEEVEPLDGYEILDQLIEFTIGEKQTEVITLEVDNEIILGSIQLTKVDADNDNAPLEGVVFELQDANGEVIQDNLTTNGEGLITIDELRPGTYYFVEVEALDHYEQLIEPIEVVVELGQTETATVTVENELITGSVELTKKGENGHLLEGVVFELQDETGEPIDRYTTDEEGKIFVDDLKPGFYQFVEVESIPGYELNPTVEVFEIVKSQHETLTIEFTNELTPGTVQLTKVGEDGETLEGAEFSLVDEDGNVLYEGLTTDEDGIISVENLKPGTYSFVETKAPFGHELDDTPIEFEIEFNQQTQLNVTKVNERSTSGVELIKAGEDGHLLEGVVFELQDSEGNTLQEDLTTDENGKLIVDDLKPGIYQFVEIQTAAGYVLDQTPIEFEIELGQTVRTEVEFINELATGAVELIKHGEDGETLEGAEFRLVDEEGNILYEGLTTDENGIISVEDLKPGTYSFVETKAPFGHELDDTPIGFEIEFNQQETLQLTMDNERTTGSVELTKKGEDGLLLEGVVFELQDENGETLQTGLQTDENGKLVVHDLKPGNYQFVETETVAGYQLDETPIPFTIELGQTNIVSVEMINELATGSVELIKQDENGNILEGAVFNLIDQNGDVIIEGLTTDQNGQIIVNDLKPGVYQFIEVKAPVGYELNPTPIEFTIEKGQKERTTVIAINEKTPEEPEKEQPEEENELPKTATNLYNLLLVGGGLLAIGFVTLLLHRKRRIE